MAEEDFEDATAEFEIALNCAMDDKFAIFFLKKLVSGQLTIAEFIAEFALVEKDPNAD